MEKEKEKVRGNIIVILKKEKGPYIMEIFQKLNQVKHVSVGININPIITVIQDTMYMVGVPAPSPRTASNILCCTSGESTSQSS